MSWNVSVCAQITNPVHQVTSGTETGASASIYLFQRQQGRTTNNIGSRSAVTGHIPDTDSLSIDFMITNSYSS